MGKKSDEDREGEGFLSDCFFESDIIFCEEGDAEVELEVAAMA